MKTTSPLNNFLVIILWISIIGTALGIIRGFSNLGETTSSYPELFLALTSITGAVLMLRLNRWGYWMMVVARLLLIFVGLMQINELESQGLYVPSSAMNYILIRSLGQIAFLSLIMLIKKNGMNAYQILWYKMPTDNEY